MSECYDRPPTDSRVMVRRVPGLRHAGIYLFYIPFLSHVRVHTWILRSRKGKGGVVESLPAYASRLKIHVVHDLYFTDQISGVDRRESSLSTCHV